MFIVFVRLRVVPPYPNLLCALRAQCFVNSLSARPAGTQFHFREPLRGRVSKRARMYLAILNCLGHSGQSEVLKYMGGVKFVGIFKMLETSKSFENSKI